MVFREALKQVPKSGEVWCEGARVHLHPLSPHFDLSTASRYLEFAIQFTPQYGDSFIEAMRWKLLQVDAASSVSDEEYRQMLHNVNTTFLEQRCVNADPNYGALWFHCKRGPFDTARQVLRTAKLLLIAEIGHFRSVFQCAKDESHKYGELRKAMKSKYSFSTDDNNRWLKERLSSLKKYSDNADTEEQYSYCDFSTGLVSVNWLRERVHMLSDVERRKILFGSDQITP